MIVAGEAELTVSLESPPTPAAPSKPRRRWPWIVLGAAVAVIVALVVAGVSYAHVYQPLSADDGLTGPASERTIKPITDGETDTNWILVGPAGTRGTVNYTLSNNGPFAAHVTGLAHWPTFPKTSLRWAPMNGPNGGGDGYEPGLLRDSRPLPVTIRPGGHVLIQVTVTQPSCTKGNRGNMDLTLTDVPIRWNALGVRHEWDMQLTPSQFAMPIISCPSAKAIAHEG
jgi:hypothetical protein